MSSLPAALFDSDAIQKYILLQVTPTSPSASPRLLVRGAAAAQFHADVLESCSPAIHAALPGAAIAVLGGGRLAHDATRGGPQVRIYGYSVAFGKADHSVAAEILRAALGPSAVVTWSDEGY